MEKEKVVNIQPLMDSQVESQFTQQIQEDFNKKKSRSLCPTSFT
ncbi:hypothetical protein LMRF01_0371 [Listeria monocytogenes]|nr:hypothetical protein LMRF01_0371 [Listeria monocytogenes]